MSIYLNYLPEEINQVIYKEVFKFCLDEIKKIKICCMCKELVSNCINLKYNNSYCNCISCGEAICFKCWSSYYANSGGGWKSFFGYCTNCALKIDLVSI